jgi:regulator of protease activity HflC (stomatin/prohibitin superfamily)
LEDGASRAAQAKHWDLSLVDVLMQDVDGSTADLLREADRMVQKLAGEDTPGRTERGPKP